MILRRSSPLVPISLLAVFVIFADQLSKWWIIEHMLRGNPAYGFLHWLTHTGGQESFAPIPVTSFFNLVMVWNKGISFGLFQNHTTMMPYILSALGLAITIGFLWWARHATAKLIIIATGFIVGGALGNIWDRLRFGAVADFFDVYINTSHWPAFNVADSAISVGVVLLLIHLLLEKPAIQKPE